MAMVVTVFQVPTRSLAVWARALPGTDANPSTVIADRVKMLRRFIMFSFGWDFKHNFDRRLRAGRHFLGADATAVRSRPAQSRLRSTVRPPGGAQDGSRLLR